MMKSQSIKPIFALLLIGVLVLSMEAMASPITRQQAQQNALTFMQDRGKSVPMTSLRHTPMRAATQAAEPYYVFNIGDNQGYVIASGDDCTPAVLGYSDSGAIDVNNLPCNFQAWLDGYAHQIQYLQENGKNTSRAPKKIANHPAVAPMLTSNWDQWRPFNLFCPVVDDENCVTGCVATAMAQLMYYHRVRSASRTICDIPAYVTSTQHFSVDAIPAGSVIDWDNMVDDYYGFPSEPDEALCNAVANLMKYCGASLKMDYGLYGSAAYFCRIAMALPVFFNYNNKTQHVSRSNYSDEEWEEMIYSELAHSRPVISAGVSEMGAHAFVCDGYDGLGFFHINWGWYNNQGYYLLSVADDIDPDHVNPFSSNQEAVINAEPSSIETEPGAGLQFSDTDVRYFCLRKCDTNGDNALSMEEVAAVTSFYFYEQIGHPVGFEYILSTSLTSFDEFKYFIGVTDIEPVAFWYCPNLKSISLPNSIVSVGVQAFYQCYSLTSIVFPKSVSYIDSFAFNGCTGLKSVTSLASVPPTLSEWGVFDDVVYSTATLRVPIGSVEAYRTTYPWSLFQHIVGIDPSLGDINLDDEVNIADINALINNIVGGEGDCLSEFMSDVNRDGEVNIADINVLIDKILNHE